MRGLVIAGLLALGGTGHCQETGSAPLPVGTVFHWQDFENGRPTETWKEVVVAIGEDWAIFGTPVSDDVTDLDPQADGFSVEFSGLFLRDCSEQPLPSISQREQMAKGPSLKDGDRLTVATSDITYELAASGTSTVVGTEAPLLSRGYIITETETDDSYAYPSMVFLSGTYQASVGFGDGTYLSTVTRLELPEKDEDLPDLSKFDLGNCAALL